MGKSVLRLASFVVLAAAGCATAPDRAARLDASIAQCVADDPGTTLAVAVVPLRGPRDGDHAAAGTTTRAAQTSHNGRLRMHPGSVLKLLVAATAIDLGVLDPRVKVITRLLRERDGTAILLEGGGDPYLSTADLQAMWKRAAEQGALLDEEIRVDASGFAGAPLGAGWMWDDEPGPYMPWISALTVDGGVVLVTVARGPQPDSDPAILFEPRGARHFRVDAALERAPLLGATAVTITREVIGSPHVLRIAGTIAPGGRATARLSVPDPDLFTGDVLAAIADPERPAGAALRIARRDENDGVPYVELGRVERGFREILTRMLKNSDNLAAECVLRQLALLASPEVRSRGATADDGLALVSLYLLRLGFRPEDFRIVDGSGLSFYDAITADLLVAVLADMAARDTFAEFRAMLPIAGVDGTLASRFSGSPAAGRVVAKTGTLTGVSALAGYADAVDGSACAFAILAGPYVGPAAAWRARIDALAESLVKQ